MPADSNVTVEPEAAVGGTALSAEQVVKRVSMWPPPSLLLYDIIVLSITSRLSNYTECIL